MESGSSKPDGETLDAKLFEECQRRWPRFFDPKNKPIWAGISMWVQGKRDDPVVNEVMQFLEQHGRKPHFERYPNRPYRHPTLYKVNGVRTFEKRDIAQAEYYWFHCPRWIVRDGAGYHDQEGHLKFVAKDLTRQPIGQASTETACTDEFRRKVEAEGFRGFAVRPVFPFGRQTLPQPYWQLWSDRTMPGLLNRLTNMTDGAEFHPEQRAGCTVDDFYFPPLLRFPAKDVRAMEPFDFANTRERFGSGDLIRKDLKTTEPVFPDPIMVPKLIASRRFREWCLKQKLKIDWFPVALE